RKLPLASVTTTKSPPITGRPLYVRSYGTYCRPWGTEMTGLATNASLAPALRTAGRVATSLLAVCAACALDWLGDGGAAVDAAAAPGPFRPTAASAATEAAIATADPRRRGALTMVVVPS